jgi:hypothetical protein
MDFHGSLARHDHRVDGSIRSRGCLRPSRTQRVRTAAPRADSEASAHGPEVAQHVDDSRSRRRVLHQACAVGAAWLGLNPLAVPAPAAALTLADVTPPIAPQAPLTPRRAPPPLHTYALSICAVAPQTGAVPLGSRARNGSALGAIPLQRVDCVLARREQQIISIFEDNTYSVVNIFDVRPPACCSLAADSAARGLLPTSPPSCGVHSDRTQACSTCNRFRGACPPPRRLAPNAVLYSCRLASPCLPSLPTHPPRLHRLASR